MPDRLTTIKRFPRRTLSYFMLVLILLSLLVRSAFWKIIDRFS